MMHLLSGSDGVEAFWLSGTFTGYFNTAYLSSLLLKSFKLHMICFNIGMVSIRDYSIINAREYSNTKNP